MDKDRRKNTKEHYIYSQDSQILMLKVKREGNVKDSAEGKNVTNKRNFEKQI